MRHLRSLKRKIKFPKNFFNKLKPIGSQPPRLYGLAKIHKNNVPLRPVLSMPGSSYYKIAKKVSKWLAVVPECQINTSSKEISESLGDIVLDENSEIVSFDIVSLYTNVPVDDAITTCADLLYDGDYPKPPVDKETFIKLLEICSKNVIMLTNDGFYRQINGLAMGSPPAPMLANGWLSSFESTIRKDSKVYHRYMDDILKDMKKNEIDQTLTEINELDDNLKFTLERESNGTIPFLDMRIIRKERTLESTWYTKPTDTGLKMNFHALAPLKYKRSAVIGMVHRIFRACSTKRNFDESLNRARTILAKNQYPKSFVESIISETRKKLENEQVEQTEPDEEKEEKKKFYVQYRGKISDQFQRSLHKLNAPCIVTFTLKKLKTTLPSLKSSIEKSYKSSVVYKINCPRCQSCYVGYTCRHLITRIKEHRCPRAPVTIHLNACSNGSYTLSMDDVEIIASSSISEDFLMTLEALYINQLKPKFNTKDEYKSHALTLRI